MKIKGRIAKLSFGGWYPVLFFGTLWSGLWTEKEYKTPKAAKVAAERLAEKLGIIIEWEGE